MSPLLEQFIDTFVKASDMLAKALGETLYMVGVSGAIAFVVGLALALVLVTTDRGGIYQSLWFNRSLGAVVNIFRSTPFIILLVALIPFTRLVVGTSIGTDAAIVPLTIAVTPFFARVAEVSLREVDRGLVEAAEAMGATRPQILRKVLVPEALPGIVGGFTITIVSLIGATAVAGAVGAGGLGDLAIRYGYQRFNTEVMLIVIVVLILLVSGVQTVGDWLARRLNKKI